MAAGQSIIELRLLVLQIAIVFVVCNCSRANRPLRPCLGKNVTITSLFLPPFVMESKNTSRFGGLKGIVWDFVYDNIHYCFQHCDMSDINFVSVNSTDEFIDIIEHNRTDLAFPIPGSLEKELAHYDHFQDTSNPVLFYRVVESPGQAYIICLEVFQEKATKKVAKSLLASSPIFLFTFLLAGISGVCIWVLEAHANREQFPVSFARGSCEGMWWAFVSMTTVGYGDRTPKSLCGRLFGVLWILTGLIVIAMFTASATSSLTLATVDTDFGIQGQKVAVLSESEAELEASLQGAHIRVYDDFHVMYKDLKEGVIDGVLTDLITAAYQLDQIQDNDLRISHVIQKPVHYKLAFVPRRAGSQALMNNECFRNRLYNPSRLSRELMLKYIKPLKPLDRTVDTDSLFSINSLVTRSILYTLTVVFVVMFTFGFIWEIIYRRKRKRKLKIEQHYHDSDSKIETVAFGARNQRKNDVMLQINILEEGISNLSKELKKLKSNVECDISANKNVGFKKIDEKISVI